MLMRFVLFSLSAVAMGQTPVPETAPDSEPMPTVRADLQAVPVPPGIVFERIVVNPDGTIAPSTTVAGGVDEKLVYSNTMGNVAVALTAGVPIADDLALVTAAGCRLRRLEFPVIGKVDPGGVGGPYTVNYELFTNCPNAVVQNATEFNRIRLPGTAGQAAFGDDDSRLVSVSFGPEAVLPTGTTSVWLRVSSNRGNVGVVMGAPAQQGFSCDRLDAVGYNLTCNATLGGFPQASFAAMNAQLFADATCDDTFVGYRANTPSGPLFNPGANVTLADDIELDVDGCQMVAYEVAIKAGGTYAFDLRTGCDGQVIPGTERLAVNSLTASVPFLSRQVFDPPITLPKSFWFAARVSSSNGGVVLAGNAPCVGFTQDSLVVVSPTLECTSIPAPLPGLYAALNVTIICAGTPPVGACCDMRFPDEAGESVCRQVPHMNCPWPWNTGAQPAWVEGATCESNPFPKPCGQSRCCRPDAVCENLSENQCNAVEPTDGPRIWARGQYCEDFPDACNIVACVGATESCGTEHSEPGCSNVDCCAEVCGTDDYCCLVEWDRQCVELGRCGFWANRCFDPDPTRSAQPVDADSSTYFSARLNTLDPVATHFCCRVDLNGGRLYESAWFRFVATDTTARISLCGSDPLADSVFNVYMSENLASLQTECDSLIPIGCGDDLETCGSGSHARTCLSDLVPGRPYYVQIATRNSDERPLQLEVRSPCYDEEHWIGSDCNENGLADSCDLGKRSVIDCNRNDILDVCELEAGTAFDCDSNQFLDECGPVVDRLPVVTDPEHPTRTTLAVDGGLIFISAYEINEGTWTIQAYGQNGIGWKFWSELESPVEPRSLLYENNRLIVTGRFGTEAFRYAFYDNRWNLQEALDGPSHVSCELYGKSVAVETNLTLVGSGFCQYRVDSPAEQISVHNNRTGYWVEETPIDSPYPETNINFGGALSISGGRLLVGAPHFGDAIPGAYSYRRVADAWVLESGLVPNDGTTGGFFGRAVDLDGDLAIVGATVSEPGGAAYIFRWDGTEWHEEAKLRQTDNPDARFGWSVDIRGNEALVGDPILNFAYLYRRVGQHWEFIEGLQPAKEYGVSWVGYDVAILDALYVVNAFAATYVFQATPKDCNANGVPDGCDVDDNTSTDCDANIIPDECQHPVSADVFPDGRTDLKDFAVFQNCVDGRAFLDQPTECRTLDLHPSCSIDHLDFFEFQSLMSGP